MINWQFIFFLVIEGINSTCRSIDWITKGLGPVVVGQMFYNLPQVVVAIIIGSYNFVSFFVEFLILWGLYRDYPKLAIKVVPGEKEHVTEGKHYPMISN